MSKLQNVSRRIYEARGWPEEGGVVLRGPLDSLGGVVDDGEEPWVTVEEVVAKGGHQAEVPEVLGSDGVWEGGCVCSAFDAHSTEKKRRHFEPVCELKDR